MIPRLPCLQAGIMARWRHCGWGSCGPPPPERISPGVPGLLPLCYRCYQGAGVVAHPCSGASCAGRGNTCTAVSHRYQSPLPPPQNIWLPCTSLSGFRQYWTINWQNGCLSLVIRYPNSSAFPVCISIPSPPCFPLAPVSPI